MESRKLAGDQRIESDFILFRFLIFFYSEVIASKASNF